MTQSGKGSIILLLVSFLIIVSANLPVDEDTWARQMEDGDLHGLTGKSKRKMLVEKFLSLRKSKFHH